MDEFVECKHCGGELRFVQMDEIAELYPSTIICTNDKDDADLL